MVVAACGESNPTGYAVGNASSRMDALRPEALAHCDWVTKKQRDAGRGRASELGVISPVLTYVNDYGARLPLILTARQQLCGR